MKKVRVLLALMLALAMLFTVVACDDDSGAGNGDGSGEGAGEGSGSGSGEGSGSGSGEGSGSGSGEGSGSGSGEGSGSGSGEGSGSGSGEGSGSGSGEGSGSGSGEGSSQLQAITGITFSNATYSYDGNEKEIKITGNVPAGVSVSYTNNKGTDAGTYTATAVLSGEGYQTLTLNAVLKINKIDFGTLSFTGATFDYDNAAHKITLSGNVPSDATITYTGGEDGKNGATNAGSYTINVTVSHKNYNTFTASATLKINKINFGSISFTGASFEYDEESHKITVTGNIPSDATITYTGGEDGKNGATNVGSYTINVTVSHKNYNIFTGTATLKITSKVEGLSVSFFNGNIYFQNALDNNFMYSYNSGDISRVSRDKPVSMITVGSKMYYISKGLLSSGIYSYDPTTSKTECLFEVSADSLISDGTYLYYNINSLLKSENNGIYRIKISDLENSSTEITPKRLTSVKTGAMTVTDGYIYFANKSDGSKLYAISTSANNGTPTKIYDYKVSELINDGVKIYFVRSELTGSCIYSINVDGGLHTLQNDESNKVVKITMSNGKYLTLIGDYIYFLNTDMVTSNIFGDGIYKAKKDGSGWIGDALSLLIGSTKVVDGANDNIFALATDGNALYYYRANTKHLYSYNLNRGTETDVMNGFVPPVYPEYITTYYEKTFEYNGDIYYINMKDGGKLYRYSPSSQMDIRITNLSVADFAIYDGVLYYSTVRLVVNFDLYRMDLTTGEPEVISTAKCKNFVVYNGKLYYNNFSGDNSLNCMDLETLAVTVIFNEESVEDNKLTVYDGHLYFVADNLLYRYSFANGTASVVNKNLKPLEYIIYDGKILMMNTDGFQNNITVYDIATDKVNKIGNLGVSGVSDDLRGMFVYNGEMYFYRNVAIGSNNKGLYKIVAKGNSYEAQLVDDFDGYYICNSIVIGNNVYFMNVWQVKDSLPTPASTGKLCVLNMITKQITVLN